jgi:hypothetical protein
MGRKWLNLGCAGTDRMPILRAPDKNLFKVLQNSGMGVRFVPFLNEKGDSGKEL